MNIQNKISTFFEKLKNNFKLFKTTFPPEVIVAETKLDSYTYYKNLLSQKTQTTTFLENHNLLSKQLLLKLQEITLVQKEITKIEIVALMELFPSFEKIETILNTPNPEVPLDTWFHNNLEAKKILEVIYDGMAGLLHNKGNKKNSSGGSKTNSELNLFYAKMEILKNHLIEYQSMAIKEAQASSAEVAEKAVDKFNDLLDKEKVLLEETQKTFFADLENSKDDNQERE